MTGSLSALGLLLAVSLSAGSAAAAPPPDASPSGDVVTSPGWEKKPTPEDLRAVYPTKALKAGVGGRATIECEVATDGLLRNCVVLKDDPAGMNFGAAALALTLQFRFKPATRNGVPFVSRVVIPITWEEPSRASSPYSDGPGPSVVTNPTWATAPTRADLRAAYPKGRKDAGAVTLMCYLRPSGALRSCTVDKGGPFDSAARSLISKFTVDLTGVDPKRIQDVEVQVLIHFDPSDDLDAGGATIVNRPNWKQLPGMDDFRAIYPAAALAKGIKVGHGLVRCVVGGNGALGDCRILSEDPPGLGFGDAALKLAATFRLNPWTEDGRPVDGAVINIPIKLVFPDDAPPAPAAAPQPKG